jgi:hypothetical protein
MYTNNLFQDGDVLGGEEEVPAAESPPAVEAYVMQQSPGPFKGQLQAPIQSPGSPKVRTWAGPLASCPCTVTPPLASPLSHQHHSTILLQSAQQLPHCRRCQQHRSA